VKRFFEIAILLFIFLSLEACKTKTALVPTSIAFVPSSTVTPTLTRPVSEEIIISQPVRPVSTETIAPHQPTIRITKVYEIEKAHPVAWFPEGNKYAILLDEELAVYTIPHELVWSRKFHSIEMSPVVGVSSDGKYVIVYTITKGIVLFDSSTGNEIKSYRGDCFVSNYANSIVVQNNLVYVGFDGDKKSASTQPIQVRVWDISPLQCDTGNFQIPVSNDRPALIYTMGANLEYLFVVSVFSDYGVYQGYVTVFDAKNNYKKICETAGTYAIFRPQKGYLAILNNSGNQLSYLDIKSCQPLETFSIPAYDQDQEMVFTPDGNFLIIRRNGFLIIQGETGMSVFEVKMDIDSIFGEFVISPDGHYFFSTYADSSLKSTFWQIER
jgi:hypothetical protein